VLYQVNTVPAENSALEYEHNQNVHDEMQELRNAIRNAGTTGNSQSASITLGTQYPTRTFSMNPPDPGGTLETVRPESKVRIEPENESKSYEYETRFFAYEPDYNEYNTAPRTVVEHSLPYNQFEDANVSVASQQVIQNERITLVLLDGNLSKSASGLTSVNLEPLDGPRTRKLAAGTVLTIPTERKTIWEDELRDTKHVSVRKPSAEDEIEIELGKEFELDIARVGVGQGATSSDDFDIGSEKEASSGQQNGTRFNLEWRAATVAGNDVPVSGGETTVKGAPSNTVTMTAGVEEYADLQGGRADFSFSDPDGVIDDASFDPDPTFTNGSVTVDLTIDAEATDGDEAKVFVSSGGGLAVATISVDAPDVNLEASNAVSTGGDNSRVEFELKNAGDETITLDEISLDDVKPADPTRVNDAGGGREILFTADGEVIGEVDTANTDTNGIQVGKDSSRNPFAQTKPFEPGQTAIGEIGPFRPDDWYAVTDMSGQTLDMTIRYETESGATGQEQITLEIDSPSIDEMTVSAAGTGNDRFDITASVSDPNNDLSRVEFEMRDTANTLVDSHTDDSIDGGTGTVSTRLQATGNNRDSEYTITTTVFDTAGNSETVTRTITSN